MLHMGTIQIQIIKQFATLKPKWEFPKTRIDWRTFGPAKTVALPDRHCFCQSRASVQRAISKTAVTPLLTHWSYCSLALSHRSKGTFTVGAISWRHWRWKWVTKIWTGLFTLGTIWRDVTGRHDDVLPEMAPAPILSRQFAISLQILQLNHYRVDIARETSCNNCYTMTTSRLV